ncbi:hypothetical protein BGX27_006503 [Mortierella sp. AM989]|nr:hypothetical protein BGX27_006503 [Mortierella sp. AM989]
MPSIVRGDITCTQYGSDTFRVGSILKFHWNDTASVPISTFTLDFYCYQSSTRIMTLATLDTITSVSPQSWAVDQSIMNTLSECPLNQYQARFDWTYTDPYTGASATGFTPCKSILLVGPGVVPPAEAAPAEPQPTDDVPGPVIITDKTKMVVIGVGCAVGVLILAGFVGFYFIRYKNRRAEQDSASKKLREPLSRPSSSVEGDGFGGNQNVVGATGYAPVSKEEMVEMGGVRPMSYSNSRPQSFVPGLQTPIATHPYKLSTQPSALSQPSGPFVNDRPASLLTSPFTPPGDNSRTAEEREQQRQQYEQQMLHQQQIQHQQQQQQQQQLSYGGY